MNARNDLLLLRLDSIAYEAENIHSYTFVSPETTPLPSFTAGAHVEVFLGNGQSRCYSLFNSPEGAGEYKVAIAKSPNGKGGSKYFHESARVGQLYQVSYPRNNFQLVSDTQETVLIAGGIGITPLLSMASYLEDIGRPWKLYYRARTRKALALLDKEFFRKNAEKIQIILDDEEMEQERAGFFDRILDAHGNQLHYYCCGPNPMLTSFMEATEHLPSAQVHYEYFSSQAESAREGGFTVVLQKSNQQIQVGPGQTILDSLLGNHITVPYSCREGICGACEVPVLSGDPEHRDSILTPSEKAAGKSIFVCCSGCKGDTLVLDL